MALINPTSLYTGGNERLNSTPSVNFYAQLQAKKQAKEDAFDQYITGLAGKLTPTGVRVQDIPEFNDKVQKWKGFVIQNRKAMNNPEVQMKANELYQDAAAVPVWSKSIEEQKKPFVDKAIDPEWRSKVNPKIFDVINAHDQPKNIQDENGNWVSNPNWKPIDYNDVVFNPKPFDYSKTYSGWIGGLKPGEVLGEQISKDPISGKVRINYEKKFDETQIPQILQRAKRSLQDNPEIADYYDHRFDTLHPDEWQKLNEIYQSIPGTKKQQVRPDGVIIEDKLDSPEKLAMAEAYQSASVPTEKGTRDITDQDLAYNRRLQAMAFNSGLIQGRGGGNNLTQQPNGNAFDQMPDKQYKNFYVKDGSFYNQDGTPKSGNVFLMGSEIPSAVRSTLKAGGLDPDDLNYGVDAVVVDGKIKSISNKKIGSVTREVMQGVYQRKMDTEPKGAAPLNFGRGNGTQSNTPYSNITILKDKSGKEIEAGVKDGKWYNTKTGKAL